MLPDSDAAEQAREAIRSKLIKKDRCFVLSKGNIEDCYPVDILGEGIGNPCGKKAFIKTSLEIEPQLLMTFLRSVNTPKIGKLRLGKSSPTSQ
ncbi:MAG: hypothetical protein OEY88_06620 [Candidatus Bathyarchaeota archaeon]|nr:hypothetical protein [Candidatus Bathyarchaeota archaeon]